MNYPITFILLYLVGAIIAAFGIKLYNSSRMNKSECIPPVVCLFTWFAIIAIGFVWLWDKAEHYKIFEKIDEFFNNTNKNSCLDP